jgi:hypothetical protein
VEEAPVFVVVAVAVGCWAHLLLGWEMSGKVREVGRIRDRGRDLDLGESAAVVVGERLLRGGRRGMLCVNRRL